MPKPRTLDTGFFDDPDIANLTRDERLLLVGMISSCADDEGRLMADPGYLRKKVFGYDDDVTKADVERWRDNILVHCHNVKMYKVASQYYIWLCNWAEYQGIRYVVASRLPAYSVNCDVPPSNKEDCGKFPQIPANSPSVGLSSVALGSVGLGESAVASDTPPTPTAKPKRDRSRETSYPDDFTPTPAMIADAKAKYPSMDILAATETWANSMKANKSRYRYTDWNQAWWNGMGFAESKGMHRIEGDNDGLTIQPVQRNSNGGYPARSKGAQQAHALRDLVRRYAPQDAGDGDLSDGYSERGDGSRGGGQGRPRTGLALFVLPRTDDSPYPVIPIGAAKQKRRLPHSTEEPPSRLD